MKKLALITLSLFFSAFAGAQSLDKLIEEYSKSAEASVMYITQSMLGFFEEVKAELEDDDRKQFEQLVSALDNVKVLTLQSGKEALEFLKELDVIIEEEEFENLFNLNEDDRELKILIKKQGDNIKEVLVSTAGELETICVRIKGNLSTDQLKQLRERLQIEGLDELGHLEEDALEPKEEKKDKQKKDKK